MNIPQYLEKEINQYKDLIYDGIEAGKEAFYEITGNYLTDEQILAGVQKDFRAHDIKCQGIMRACNGHLDDDNKKALWFALKSVVEELSQ